MYCQSCLCVVHLTEPDVSADNNNDVKERPTSTQNSVESCEDGGPILESVEVVDPSKDTSDNSLQIQTSEEPNNDTTTIKKRKKISKINHSIN